MVLGECSSDGGVVWGVSIEYLFPGGVVRGGSCGMEVLGEMLMW